MGPPSCLALILTGGPLNWEPLKMPHSFSLLGGGSCPVGCPSPFCSFDLQASDLGIQSPRAVLCPWRSGSTLWPDYISTRTALSTSLYYNVPSYGSCERTVFSVPILQMGRMRHKVGRVHSLALSSSQRVAVNFTHLKGLWTRGCRSLSAVINTCVWERPAKKQPVHLISVQIKLH